MFAYAESLFDILFLKIYIYENSFDAQQCQGIILIRLNIFYKNKTEKSTATLKGYLNLVILASSLQSFHYIVLLWLYRTISVIYDELKYFLFENKKVLNFCFGNILTTEWNGNA